LRPLGNPGTYRVRDLWVDEQSYQTRKLVTDGNFTLKETGSGLWTVTYVKSGDAWYLGPLRPRLRTIRRRRCRSARKSRFGIAGSTDNALAVEPSDPLPRR
jgi:hypothetical protein